MIRTVGTQALDAGSAAALVCVVLALVLVALVVVVVVLVTLRVLAALTFLSSCSCKSRQRFCLRFISSIIPQMPRGTCVLLIAVFCTDFP